jgi:hypothetical protein
MQFVASHDVTAEDLARAAQLATRWTDILLSVLVVVVLTAILSQVLYAFWLYLRAVVDSPTNFADLLRLDTGGIDDTVFAWLSIIVTLGLPIFLFFALRSLAETIWPPWRVRRLIKHSNVIGPTTYTVSNEGARAARAGGADVFLPWSSFDGMRADAEIAALTRKGRLLFFVPLAAFGSERDAVLAHISSRVRTAQKPL